MFKLIIVDDEEIAREGLSQFIEWKQLGFELVQCFADGKEAIDYLKNHSVDVVLTDIDMVDISGLDLSKYIYENVPNVKTVIISGHKNFEYAKAAIKYNVEYYLTKPIDMSEIRKVFVELKKSLLDLKRIQNENKEKSERYQKLLPILKEQFLLYILTGSIRDEDELNSRLQAIGLPAYSDLSYSCIIDVEINNIHKEHNGRFKSSLQRIFQDNRNNVHYLSFYYSQNLMKILAISSKTEKSSMKENINHFLNEIKQSIHQNFEIELSLEKGPIYNDLFELSRTMRLHTTSYNNGLKVEEKSQIDLKEYRQFMYKYKRFIPLLINGEQEKIKENLNVIFEEIEPFPITDIQRLITDLFVMITQSFAEYGIDIFTNKNETLSYHDILEMDDVDEIRNWSNHCLDQLMKDYLESQDSETNQIISKAMDYIQSRYYEDISLDDVADYIYLNPVYFSRLFKDYTGRNFSEYLRTMRVEKAIELLEENKYKVYEISNKVGYKSSKYFSRVFKQHTGFSPQEYSYKVLNSVDTISR